jgi:uncharacterized membrane protein
MKWRSRVGMVAAATSAAMLASIVLKASHPPAISGAAHTARATQATADPSGNGLYQFTTINFPGVSDTEAYGLNDAGLVSGFYVNNGIGRGFLWRNGSFTSVVHDPDDPSENTLLGEVNGLGLVVGNYGPFTVQHAAIYSILTGQWTTLPDVPNLPINIGDGINLFGIATGSAAMGTVAGTSDSIGWTWDGRNYSFFSAPGAALAGTAPIGINDLGLVCGYFQDVNGVYHGFLKEGSRFTDIDVPGATGTYAYGLNDLGEVVGTYTDQQGNSHGFVLRAGNFTTVDVPGSLGTLVTNVNDLGDLVGLWFDANATHAFLASHR